MKKKIIITTIILLTFILACFAIYVTSNKEEYKLIEITGQELTNTLLIEDTSITFALYNERDVQAEDFIKDLEKTANQAQENIYYVNTAHSTTEFGEIMSAITSIDPNILSYYVIQDGKLILYNTYTSFNNMYKDLNGKKYDTNIVKTSKEEKLASIKKAQNSYKDGDIASAYNHLANAYDLKEAKEEYENNKYYQILGSWEIHELYDNGKKTHYTNFYFMNHNPLLYIATKDTKFDGFEKPVVSDYENYTIQIKDDWIYIKNEKNNKYTKKYEIISLSKYSLILKDGNKEYNFQYGY